MKINKKSIVQKNKGFTLIETLVSLALFTIVVVMLGGVIVSVININKRNQIISGVVNNLNYSIDSMVRDIKTGYAYNCNTTLNNFTVSHLLNNSNNNTGCPASNLIKKITLISTISGVETVVTYELVEVPYENSYINKTVYNLSGDEVSKYSITDRFNVNIEKLIFGIKDYDSLDCTKPICDYGQPSVSILIKGSAGDNSLETSKFYIQTFATQRKINLN